MQKYFLTVDWCNKGRRGVFCDREGNGFWKEDAPHTEDEIFEILDMFEFVLSPQSLLLSEDELKEYTHFIPLAEYSYKFGRAIKPDTVSE